MKQSLAMAEEAFALLKPASLFVSFEHHPVDQNSLEEERDKKMRTKETKMTNGELNISDNVNEEVLRIQPRQCTFLSERPGAPGMYPA